mgnify:CR=1 FL=1
MKKLSWDGKNGPLLIAEIGGNHEGDFAYAKRLTKLAIKSDVDIIKFQIYSGETLVNNLISPNRFKHFKKFQLSKKQHIYLAEMCLANGIKYLSSIWDTKVLKWLDKYLEIYKIGSGDLTAYPIIKEFAKKGKPIILSSGLSNSKEIKNTINFLISKNKKYGSKEFLSVLQCTSSYPTIDQEANLKIVTQLVNNNSITAGYSDHTIGSLALKSAYTLGAQILEFHFTDTRKNKTFRDHKVSLNLNETKELIIDLKRIKNLLGTNIKKPTASEIKSKHLISFRRGIYLNKNLEKDAKIKESDLVCLRPNIGVDARDYKNIIGRKVKRNIKKLEKLTINKNV